MGNTPLVKLNKVNRGVPGEIYVKCEFLNPGGSIKDRIGHYMIEQAEKKGELKPGRYGSGSDLRKHGRGAGIGVCD